MYGFLFDRWREWTENQTKYSKALSYTASRSTNFEDTQFRILPKIVLIFLFSLKLHWVFQFLEQNLKDTLKFRNFARFFM